MRFKIGDKVVLEEKSYQINRGFTKDKEYTIEEIEGYPGNEIYCLKNDFKIIDYVYDRHLKLSLSGKRNNIIDEILE